VTAPALAPAATKRAAPLALLARWPAAWIALAGFLLYLPIVTTTLQLGPDPIDYLDLGRHLAAGQGYVLAIKAYFFGEPAVVHQALDQRAPLYPLLVALLFRLGLDEYAVQVVNAALAATCAALVYALGSRLFDRRTGLLAGLLAAASPAMLIHSALPMTEPLALCLTLAPTWLLLRDLDHPTPRSFGLAGLLLGLAYLTRPVTLPMGAALLLGVVLATRPRMRAPRRALLRPLLVLVACAALFVLPITAYSLATRGTLSYLSNAWYSVLDEQQLISEATLQPLPAPAAFLRDNAAAVAATILRKARQYLALLFLDDRWLLPLVLAWPAVLLALFRRQYPRAALPVLLLAAANFLVYALSWMFYARRFMLLTLLLLLPFAVDGLRRLGLDRRLPRLPALRALDLLVALVILFWLQTFVQQYQGLFREAGGGDLVGTRTAQGLRWTGPPSWVEDRELRPILDWVQANTDPGDTVAARYPHPYTFFAGRPSVQLPRNLDPLTLRRFLVDYRVGYVSLSNVDSYRRRYQDELVALEPAGVRLAGEVGSYRVFDTRALWR
jgi:hypothetical protein